MVLAKVDRILPSSIVSNPAIVEPAGVVTPSLISAGWAPVSSTILAAPFIAVKRQEKSIISFETCWKPEKCITLCGQLNCNISWQAHHYSTISKGFQNNTKRTIQRILAKRVQTTALVNPLHLTIQMLVPSQTMQLQHPYVSLPIPYIGPM
jgi:hypothetical protein